MGGMGSVGKALVSILSKNNTVYIDDLVVGRPDAEKIDYLHVSIPYGSKFISDVIDCISFYRPENVIVHSTVPVGTTRVLFEKFGKMIPFAHAPIRGQHSELEKSIRNFTMPVSASSHMADFMTHMYKSGIVTENWDTFEETELAKMLCLSRYLNDLAFMQSADDICQFFGINRDVVTKWTKTYNEGYKGTNYKRPVFSFPNGVVGGTCVIPVSSMLQEQSKSDFILRNIKLFEGTKNGDGTEN